MYYGASTENLLYLNVSAKVQTLRQSLFTENPLSPAACTEFSCENVRPARLCIQIF